VDEQSMNEPLWRLFEVDQQRITALDTSIVAIRGWAITLDSALAGFAVSQNDRAFFLVALLATAFFTVLDLGFRNVQLRHVDRARRVEAKLVPLEYRFRPVEALTEGVQASRPQVRSARAYWSTLVFHVPLAVLLAVGAALVG
jgi:hypothetical protein